MEGKNYWIIHKLCDLFFKDIFFLCLYSGHVYVIAVHGIIAAVFCNVIHVCVLDPDLMELFLGLIMDPSTVVRPSSLF